MENKGLIIVNLLCALKNTTQCKDLIDLVLEDGKVTAVFGSRKKILGRKEVNIEADSGIAMIIDIAKALLHRDGAGPGGGGLRGGGKVENKHAILINLLCALRNTRQCYDLLDLALEDGKVTAIFGSPGKIMGRKEIKVDGDNAIAMIVDVAKGLL